MEDIKEQTKKLNHFCRLMGKQIFNVRVSVEMSTKGHMIHVHVKVKLQQLLRGGATMRLFSARTVVHLTHLVSDWKVKGWVLNSHRCSCFS